MILNRDCWDEKSLPQMCHILHAPASTPQLWAEEESDVMRSQAVVSCSKVRSPAERCMMRRQSGPLFWVLLGSNLIAALGLGFVDHAFSQSAKAKFKGAAASNEDLSKYISKLNRDESPIAVGKTVTLVLANGKILSELEVTELLLGSESEILKSLSVADRDGKKKQKLGATSLTRIRSGDHDFNVVLDPSRKGHVLIDVAARDADVNERLKTMQQRLWPEPTDEERAKTIADYKEFLKRVQASYQAPCFLQETEFFLFFTDLPAAQVPPYVANLDKMYFKLCEAFGVPKGKNIFLGKCIIVAFAKEESFLAFEEKFLDNPNAKGAQGLAHGSSDGRAIIACFRGHYDVANFGALLVHETTHGVTHRLRSTVAPPKWIGEGMADWAAHAVVPRKSAFDRQKESVVKVQKSGSLGGNFFDQDAKLEAWQYDIASHLVSFLAQLDPGRFRAFFMNIKEGDTPEEALARSYGLTPAELLTQYGRSIGVANLRP